MIGLAARSVLDQGFKAKRDVCLSELERVLWEMKVWRRKRGLSGGGTKRQTKPYKKYILWLIWSTKCVAEKRKRRKEKNKILFSLIANNAALYVEGYHHRVLLLHLNSPLIQYAYTPSPASSKKYIYTTNVKTVPCNIHLYSPNALISHIISPFPLR